MRIALFCSSCLAAMTMAAPTLAAPASAATPAAAADQASQAPELGEVIVTAQKREERVNTVPMSITAVSHDELQKRGVDSPDDIAKIVSGFVYTKSAYGTPVYTLRGIGFYDYSLGATPAVTVYVDQAPYAYAQLAEFAALDLERVEVLKGPQGTLFGVNSTGGAINYVTAKPTKTLTGDVSVTEASYGETTAHGYVSGPISDTLGFRLSGQTDQGGGWQKSITTGETFDDKHAGALRLLLDWNPVSAFHAALNVNFGIDRSDGQAPQFLSVTPASTANSYYKTALPQLYNFPQATNARQADWGPSKDYYVHNSQGQGVLSLSYDLAPGLTLKSLTSGQKFFASTAFDSDGTPFAVFDGTSAGELSVVFQDIGLYGDTERAKWVVAANYESDSISQTQIGGRPGLVGVSRSAKLFGVDFLSSVSNQDATAASVYGNLDYKLTPQLTATGGVRYTQNDRNFSGCSYALDASTAAFLSLLDHTTIPVGGCVTVSANHLPLQTVRSKLDQDNVSWRFGLNWTPTADTLVYGNISRGYKSGAYPIIAATSYLQLRPVNQENVLAYEVGFKATVDRVAQLNGAVFYYDYTDKQIRGRFVDPVFGAISTLVNVPKSAAYGAELQGRWRPLDGLTLSGEATYLHTEILGDFNNINFVGGAQNFKGQVLPFSPSWSANTDAEYVHPVSDSWKGFVGASVVYQSASNAGLGELSIATIRDFTTLDLRAGLTSDDGRWKLSVWARNVTDEYHWTSVALVTDVVVRYAAPPRLFGVTVDRKF